MADLKAIMKRAWAILNDRRGYCEISTAMKMSWAIEHGHSHGFEAAYVDDNHRCFRTHGFASSAEAAKELYRTEMLTMKDKGRRSLGPVEFSLKVYAQAAAPSVEDEPAALVAPTMARAA